MKYPIYTHHTARHIADMELSDATVEGLLKPKPLTPRVPLGEMGLEVREYLPEDHVVKLSVPGGEAILFLIAVNGQRRIATTTPELILANAGA